MSLATAVARAERLGRNPLFGIGRWYASDGPVDFRVSWEDVERDSGFAERWLAAHGAEARDSVVVVGGAPDAPWLRPIELALQRLHVPLSSSELWPFDALRTATLARRLRPRAVIGPDQALSAALAGDDGYVAALRDVPAVFTRLGGAEPLRAVGLAPRTIAFLGPAIGLEWPDGRLLVDGTEWSLRSADGQLLLSTRGERAEPVEDLPLGIAGAVTATDGTDLQVTLH